MQTAIATVVMRGGTSRGLYFWGADLPSDPLTRDQVLLAAMGSPDDRQIDGMGGAHPLTSKVAIVTPSDNEDADVDYLFLQVHVEKAEVSGGQNCGNLLAGVGQYAIEKGLVTAATGETEVRIRMLNSGGMAVATIQTPDGTVSYEGVTKIDGVPGTAAPVMLNFENIAGSTCGRLLPTGNVTDEVDGISVSCIDNGMPVVLLRATDFGMTGKESPAELESDAELKARIEDIRLQLGPRMNLGDVTAKTVPKMCLVAPATEGGALSTRTLIPHRVHQAIGVLGAASVAAACCIPGTVAHDIAGIGRGPGCLDIEHPSGRFTVDIDVADDHGEYQVRRSALLRTARKIMDGHVYIAGEIWSREC